MRITRRLRERLLGLGFGLGVLAPFAACSDDASGPMTTSDAAAPDTATPVDAGVVDTSVVPHDAQTSDASARPVVCSGTGPCATALAVGIRNSFCALLSDGTVTCWGANGNAQLGRGEDASGRDSANAERVVGLTNIVSLGHGCALDKDGNAFGWGLGPWLKDLTQYATTETVPVKLPIPKASAIDAYVSVDGIATACALVDGGALCWGQNSNGQLGAPEAGADLTQSLPPVLTPLTGLAPPKGVFVGVATFVVHEDGTVSSFGASPPLGRVSSLFPDPYPGLVALQGVTSVDIVGPNVCATADGIAYCWGQQNVEEQFPLMLPTPTVTSEPIVRIATSAFGGGLDPARACMIGVSGDVFCVGNNLTGEVGDGTTNYALTPTKALGLTEPVSDIKITSRTTCVLTVSGRVYCWGDDENGQLGSGKILVPRNTPGEVVLP